MCLEKGERLHIWRAFSRARERRIFRAARRASKLPHHCHCTLYAELVLSPQVVPCSGDDKTSPPTAPTRRLARLRRGAVGAVTLAGYAPSESESDSPQFVSRHRVQHYQKKVCEITRYCRPTNTDRPLTKKSGAQPAHGHLRPIIPCVGAPKPTLSFA